MGATKQQRISFHFAAEYGLSYIERGWAGSYSLTNNLSKRVITRFFRRLPVQKSIFPFRSFLVKTAAHLRQQKGFSFIDILIALGVIGIIGVAFMNGMNTAHRSIGTLDEQSQAEALARSQLEVVENSDYAEDGVYPVTIEIPSQYSVSISTQVLDTATCVTDGNCNTLQEITVSVRRVISEGTKPVLSASCYKAKG